MESQSVLESDVVEATHTHGDNFTEVVWTVLSFGTVFVLLLFIVTCIRVILIGNITYTFYKTMRSE